MLGPGCHLKVTGVLGQGSFGKVYRAKLKEVATPGSTLSQPPRELAVKTMAKGVGSPVESKAAEAEYLAKVSDHPGVVTLHEAYEDETHMFVIMDFMKDGRLYDYIYTTEENEEVGEKEEATLKSIMLQLIDALDHCHQNDVYHRDSPTSLSPESAPRSKPTWPTLESRRRGGSQRGLVAPFSA